MHTIEQLDVADDSAIKRGHPEMIRALACPLCNSGRASWDLSAVTYGAGPCRRELFSIYHCRKCGLGITDRVPSEAESHLLYEDRTSSDFQGDSGSVAAVLKSAVADHDIRTMAAHARLRQPVHRVLDYACGNGAFALSMRKVFPDSAVWATDYHREAPPMLEGHDVNYAAYAELAAHGPFDLILCRHVLEHTYTPVKFLKGIGELLAPGGVLIVEVPNLEAPLRRIFGKYWDGYYVPYHPIHFSKAALHQAAVEAGLVPEKSGGCEMPKIGRSLRNVLGCRYNSALFAAGILLHPLQYGARSVTGQPTCLRLWARKPL